MPTQVLAVGTTAADSSDVVVASGSQLTVGIKDAAGTLVDSEAMILVMLKDDAGQYFRIDYLSAARPALVLSMGTWRLSRIAGASCGLQKCERQIRHISVRRWESGRSRWTWCE